MRVGDFGEGFTWGVASAAWQIEGAWDADGKTPSVWDHAGHRRRVRGGPLGDVAIDFAHRYRADIEIVRGLGFGAKRLSFAWPRIIPGGTGRPSPAGIAFYDRIIDACLEASIEPWFTLYHWDLPQRLHERGGWANRDVVGWFGEYADACAAAFGDRVRHWMVFNEPNIHALHLSSGIFDRFGLHLRRYFTAAHHMNLATAEGGRRLRDALPAGADVGTTHQVMPFRPWGRADPWQRRALRAYEAIVNGIFLDPLGGRGYPWGASGLADRHLRRVVRDGDEELATHRFDFLGIQYYWPPHLRRAPIPGLWGVPTAAPGRRGQQVRTALRWPVEPRGLGVALRRYAGHPVADRLVVTENGAAFEDRVETVSGERRVHDGLRTWFYASHLAEVLAARREGVPVDGYFCWSYADNIEWALGAGPRFGLVHVDYDDDLRRTPKDSARWFQRFLAGAEV